MAGSFWQIYFQLTGHVLIFDAEIVYGVSPELASEGNLQLKSKLNAT